MVTICLKIFLIGLCFLNCRFIDQILMHDEKQFNFLWSWKGVSKSTPVEIFLVLVIVQTIFLEVET